MVNHKRKKMEGKLRKEIKEQAIQIFLKHKNWNKTNEWRFSFKQIVYECK